MKKKAPAGRVTEKEKTEKIIRKIKADLTSSPKSGKKRKEAKSPPSQKKAPQKKVRLKTSSGKGKVKKEKPEKRKRETVKRISPKKERPSVKKAGTKKKEKAVSKKVKTITAEKIITKLPGKEKAAKKEKPGKPSARAKTEKKPALPASGRKRAVPKPAAKPAKKIKVATGAKTEIKKKTEKSKKQLTTKRKKTVLSEEIKKEKVLKILSPEVTGKEKKTIKAGRIYRGQGFTDTRSPKTEEAKEVREEKKAYFAGEDILPPVPSEPLPSEYGENSIALITVNPHRVFAFWEVREDTLKIFQGTLTMRLYDITGIDFDHRDANSYADREVSERTGDLYLDVSPAKDYVADIGILYSGGIFITIARSHKVSTPAIAAAEEGESPEKEAETKIRVGY
jgi:uncharacterized protein